MPYPAWLLVVFAIFFIACMIRPADRVVWMTEASFTILVIPLLIWMHSRWPIGNLSYTLIFIFLCLHTLGGHYTYAKVPYDRWFAKVFGRELKKIFGFRRNHYDRLVHFAFGLLLAYPVYELCAGSAQARGAWNYVLAGSLIISASTIFELMEWALAAALGGSAGQDYLAAQGDEWDAHKDMALAALGAVLALGAAALR